MPMRLKKYIQSKSQTKQTFVKLDKIYYINLDRRKDREKHFLQQCHNANINIKILQKFVAIDGKTFTPTSQEEKMFLNCA